MGSLQGTLTLETVDAGLRFRARFGEWSHVLDSGEAAEGPSPVMALVESLAACEAMDVIGILRKKRQVVSAYRVEMHAERATEHPRRLTSVTLVHHLTGTALDPSAVSDALRLSDEKYCSVRHSLRPDIVVEHRIELHGA